MNEASGNNVGILTMESIVPRELFSLIGKVGKYLLEVIQENISLGIQKAENIITKQKKQRLEPCIFTKNTVVSLGGTVIRTI